MRITVLSKHISDWACKATITIHHGHLVHTSQFSQKNSDVLVTVQPPSSVKVAVQSLKCLKFIVWLVRTRWPWAIYLATQAFTITIRLAPLQGYPKGSCMLLSTPGVYIRQLHTQRDNAHWRKTPCFTQHGSRMMGGCTSSTPESKAYPLHGAHWMCSFKVKCWLFV